MGTKDARNCHTTVAKLFKKLIAVVDTTGDLDEDSHEESDEQDESEELDDTDDEYKKYAVKSFKKSSHPSKLGPYKRATNPAKKVSR